MSRNFELLQNIGKEEEYFQAERVVVELAAPIPEPLPNPITETVSVGIAEEAVPVVPEASAAPRQFSFEDGQLAELTKLVQRVFLLPGSEFNHTVVFASSDAGNGCSWICARVGELLASQVTGTVCLVDANLHHPTLHEQLGVSNHHGLADALRQPGSVRGYISQLSRKNLALVSCGSEPESAQSFLTSDRMRTRLNELRSEFDYVLVDCPSMAASNEAVSLGAAADGVVLVLKANATRKDRARSAVRDLQAAKVKVLGAVLNQRTFPIPENIYNKL